MRTCATRERVLFGLLGAIFALLPVITVVLALEEPVGTPLILWAAALAALMLAAVTATGFPTPYLLEQVLLFPSHATAPVTPPSA